MLIEIVSLFSVGVVLAAFAFGLRAGIATLIIIRPLCDRFFELARFDVMGHLFSYGAILNVVVISVLMINVLRIRQCIPAELRNIWLPFLLVSLVASLYSPVQIDGVRKLLTYVSFFALFMFSFLVANSERSTLRFLKLVILSSVLPVAYGLFQVISGIDSFVGTRTHSTFSHPNIFAFYILAIMGTIFYVLTTGRAHVTDRLRLILNIYLIPLLVVLLMTSTRSAWLAGFILFLLYGILYDRRLLICVLSLPILALVIPAVRDRIADLASGNEYAGWMTPLNSYAWRKLLWERSFAYIWERPIFGYGLDSFHFYSPEFFPLEPSGTYAHNVYIQFQFESGLIGLIAFLWIFWRCFGWLARRFRIDSRRIIMTMGIMGAYLVACYSDNVFEYLSVNWCFWFVIGLIFAHIAQLRPLPASLGRRTNFGRRSRIQTTGSVAAASVA
jgi:putative inorganic carbon (HCO3(-)) transporter